MEYLKDLYLNPYSFYFLHYTIMDCSTTVTLTTRRCTFICKPHELDTLAGAFSASTNELCVWMKSNRLKINCDKTAKNLTVPVLQVDGSTIQPTDGARNLGVFLTIIFT